MIDFSTLEEIGFWLAAIRPDERCREVAVALAARVALRVLPLVIRTPNGKPREGEHLSRFALPVFRAVVVPCAASWRPARAAELTSAASAAVRATMSAIQDQSVNASCASANAVTTLDPTVVANAAAGAINAARSAARSAGGLDAFDRALNEDAAVIDGGCSGVDLIGQSLWMSEQPNWPENRWRELKDALLQTNQGWEVWTEWYEARLAGDAARPPNEALEVARATIPDEIWRQGPAVVNGEIKRRIDEHEKGGLVVDDPRASIAKGDDRDQDKATFAPILATRAALRALPLFAIDEYRLSDAARSQSILATFRALAVAWARVRFPDVVNRQWCVAAGRNVGGYVRGSELERHLARSAADAAFAAGSETSGAAAARAESGQIEAQHAIAIAPDRAAQGAARLANASDAADVVAGVNPGQVAEVALWPGRDPPPFLRERWNVLKKGLSAANEGWEVWIDWYEARLDGRVQPKEVELAYVEFIRNVVDSAPARVANAEITRLIDAAAPRSQSPRTHWDFFISYATEDEASAREVVGVLEVGGYSTAAQFKDFGVGANFVNEMIRGLAGMGRFVALYSPNYQASPHCQAEWATAYAVDPSGAKRKIVPFLLAPTALDPLARQVVYKSLVGLTETQRKAAILEAIALRRPTRDPEAIKSALAEVASPQASINANAQLDAGPNATFDRPFVDADLPELPSIQRGLADTICESLPRNTPPVVGVALEHYSDHLLERGTQPIVRYLDDLAAALRTEHDAPESIDWGKGLATLFQRFFANDALLRTHFPLKSEETFAELPIDEDQATGPTLTEPIDNVAAALQGVVAANKATPAIAKAVTNSAAFARDLASLPPAQIPPDPNSKRVTVKRRYLLGTIGFLVTIYGLIGTTASIYGIPEGAALLKAVSDAIEKLMSLLL
jgi:hypothetical protein